MKDYRKRQEIHKATVFSVGNMDAFLYSGEHLIDGNWGWEIHGPGYWVTVKPGQWLVRDPDTSQIEVMSKAEFDRLYVEEAVRR